MLKMNDNYNWQNRKPMFFGPICTPQNWDIKSNKVERISMNNLSSCKQGISATRDSYVDKNEPKKLEIDNTEIKNIFDYITPENIFIRTLNVFLSSTEPQRISKVFTNIIAFLIMNNLKEIMKQQGFEKSFSFLCEDGQVSTPTIETWNVDDEQKEFVKRGMYLFWEKDVCSQENIFVQINSVDSENSVLTIFSTNKQQGIDLLAHLQEYTKKDNVLQKCCMKDMYLGGTFETLQFTDQFSFDNFYYEQKIIDLCDVEIVGFLKNLDAYVQLGMFKRGLLCHGEAGGGKSSLNKIICRRVKEYASVLWITPDVLLNNASRSSLGTALQHIYAIAQYLTPCIILYEDIDLFAGDRYNGNGTTTLGTLMNFLDGINTVQKVITIATTNRLDLVEGAIRNRPGRFDRIVEIPRLNDVLRKKMFTDKLKGWTNIKKYHNYLVEKTQGKKNQGWTGAEVQELINTLNIQKISTNSQKRLNKTVVDKALSTMEGFGIESAQANKDFGFAAS